MTTTRRALCLAFALSLTAGPASADTLYSYVGDTLRLASGVYTPNDRITGSFTVAAEAYAPSPAAPWTLTPWALTWSFTDGHQTLTEANSVAYFNVWLDSSVWDVTVNGLNGYIRVEQWGDRFDYAQLGPFDPTQVATDRGMTSADGSHSGTWTVTVPEPGTLVLMTVGLAVLLIGRRMEWI